MPENLKPLFQAYLMASYGYYILNASVISDEMYDNIAKLLLAHFADFDHQHKYLVSKDDLTAGTLYHLRGDDYPLMVQLAAERWVFAPDAEKKERSEHIKSLLGVIAPAG